MKFQEAYEAMKSGVIFRVAGFGEVFLKRTESFQLMCNSPKDPLFKADPIPDKALYDLLEAEFEETDSQLKRYIEGCK